MDNTTNDLEEKAKFEDLIIESIGNIQEISTAALNDETDSKISSVPPIESSSLLIDEPSNLPLDSLSSLQVQALLEGLNLGNFRNAFLNNQVDGATLASVENASEIQELGVTIGAKAKLLLKKLNEFKVDGVPFDLITAVDPDSGNLPISSSDNRESFLQVYSNSF
jgi:hypothetical protein